MPPTAESMPLLPAPSLKELAQRVRVLEHHHQSAPDPNTLNMLLFSGEMDRLLSAFTLATGAAASGMHVSIFVTFWGAAALKKVGPQSPGKSFIEKMFGWMLPGGWHRKKLSRLDMGGLGRWLMRQEMRKKGMPDLPTLLSIAQELGVELYLCDTSMAMMGIRKEELIDYPNLRVCGVAHFLDMSTKSNTTLFI
ncbi:MAG: NADH dehydrogenase FAD-containing subunit [Deltaproteobacteria bacterium]|nr:NADH dehydrogenase FAD-containing subunit [Deltaproteobacteria bacterium]